MIAVTEAETCADCAADGDDKTRVPFLGCDMSDVYDGEEPNGTAVSGCASDSAAASSTVRVPSFIA